MDPSESARLYDVQLTASQPQPERSPTLDALGGIEQPATIAEQPPAPSSSLLQELGRLSSPAAVSIVASAQTLAIDTVEMARAANAPASSAGVRRAPVAIQPVIRGFGQQSIYGQFQGAWFVPVRFDLDSLLTSIDPGILDNLVIIPGPYGVKYGPGLAFIDAQARPLARSDVPDWHGVNRLLYNSNGGQFYGRETVSLSGANYGARVSYGHKVGADYFSGNDTRIPSSYNVRDVDAVLAYDLAPESTLQFEYLLQEMTDTEFAGLAFDARLRQTQAFFLRFTHGDAQVGGELRADAWYNRTRFQGDNLNAAKQLFYQSNAVFNPPGAFAGVTNASSRTSGYRLAPTWGDDESVRLTIGHDLQFVRQQLNEFDDFGFGFENYPVPRSQMLDAGVFAEASLPANESTRLTVGVRLDRIRTTRFAQHIAADPDGVEHIDDFGNDFTDSDTLAHAFVTAEWTLTQELKLRSGFGHGQRPPNLTERFAIDPFLNLVQNATTAVFGDENLAPERSSQWDLSLNGDYADARFQLAGFCSYIHDHITLAPAPGIPPDPDLRLVDFVNDDSVLAGGEVSVELDATPIWMPFATLSYVDGRNLERNEPLPRIYPLQSRAGLRCHDPEEERWMLEFVAWIVDRQDRVATSLLEVPTGGFTRLDLRGHWQATEDLRLSAGVLNLGDRNILDPLSVHNPAVFEPGLNFYLATQWEH